MTTDDEIQALTGQILCMPWVKEFRIATGRASTDSDWGTYWYAKIRGEEYGDGKGIPFSRFDDKPDVTPENRLALLKMAVATLGKLQEAA